MAYNSAYKGSEIDAAVGAVKNKEKTWDDKMPAVTGTAGQMVGFDGSGNPVAQDVPATGLTEEAADRKYLKLTGGTVTGKTAIGATVAGQSGAKILVTDGKVEASGANTVGEATLRVGGVVSASDPPISTFNQTWSDGVERSADLRLGTLNSDAGFVGMTVILKNAAFSICDKTGGATYSVIVNSDGIAASYPDTATFSFSGPVTVGAGTDDSHAATVAQAIPKLTIVTLPASGWGSTTKSQTIAVAGVDADETKQWIECTGVISNQSAFDDASIKITAFAENSLTFTASTVPTVDLKVGVKIEAVKDVTPPPPPLKVYGVEWDWTSSGPTRGVRTDDAATFGDPNPAVSNGTGSSPFDNIWPWSGMVKENRSGGVEVKEPKYWFKWTKTGKKLKLQIADGPVEGFSVDPVNRDRGDGLGELDYSYIGRYHCASGYKSTTGAAQQVNITRSQARSGIHNLGSNFWQMDFAQFWYVNMLFLVEFADWNGERVGRGCSTSASKMNNGQTDAMGYHTGTTAASRDSYGFTQYRNIEGWWDNVFDWMDGCYYNSNGLNVITNPNKFSDSANGTLVGKSSSGYPSDFTIPTASGLEWALFPSASSGSATTYVPDNWNFSGGSPCLLHGGYYYQYQDCGPFCVYCYSTSSRNDGIGCRLQERPPKA
nr:MAG TPA: tail collar fiber protein [Caudoviricetes sp.]